MDGKGEAGCEGFEQIKPSLLGAKAPVEPSLEQVAPKAPEGVSMRICFVGEAISGHIAKWCAWFLSRGHEVHVISFERGEIPGADVRIIDTGVDPDGGDLGKLRYLLHSGKIRRLVREINPDIVNVHFASSYGTAAALGGIRGHVLSVWGADVYDFPRKSFLHRKMLEYALGKSRVIFSTSRAMAEETAKYTGKKIEVTPFGVDMDLFSPDKRTRPAGDASAFVVGTVKTLADKYGIADLLKAAAIVKERTEIPIRLRIAGRGPKEAEYRALAETLGVDGITEWLGYISQEQAAAEWANMDVAVIPSTLESESFGVSAVEAQACGTAVIVSDIPGLLESTEPGKSSEVVPRNDPEAIAAKMIWFRENGCAAEYGRRGRAFVEERFEINRCFERIEGLLEEYVK